MKMRLFLASVLALSLAACAAADAKSKAPVAPVQAKPAWPEYVVPSEAEEALRAIAESEVAKIRLNAALGLLKQKYGIDASRGDGWDPQPDGRLKVRRAPDEPEPRAPPKAGGHR